MQAALAAAGELGAARKAVDLDLPMLGPYSLDWTRNGRYMAIGGRKGHLALLSWQQAQPFAELQVCCAAGRACCLSSCQDTCMSVRHCTVHLARICQ